MCVCYTAETMHQHIKICDIVRLCIPEKCLWSYYVYRKIAFVHTCTALLQQMICIWMFLSNRRIRVLYRIVHNSRMFNVSIPSYWFGFYCIGAPKQIVRYSEDLSLIKFTFLTIVFIEPQIALKALYLIKIYQYPGRFYFKILDLYQDYVSIYNMSPGTSLSKFFTLVNITPFERVPD